MNCCLYNLIVLFSLNRRNYVTPKHGNVVKLVRNFAKQLSTNVHIKYSFSHIKKRFDSIDGFSKLAVFFTQGGATLIRYNKFHVSNRTSFRKKYVTVVVSNVIFFVI